MNAPTKIKLLKNAAGEPVSVVIPYSHYLELAGKAKGKVPNAVVSRVIKDGFSPARAWREHLGLTQVQVAEAMGVSQSAYAQLEAKEIVRRSTRERVAQALGIQLEQLSF